MKIYLVTRTDNYGLDEYVSIVCSAKNKKEAKEIFKGFQVDICNMIATKMGKSKSGLIGVIQASFNAA